MMTMSEQRFEPATCTFHFIFDGIHGTAFWISPKRALTAFHTFPAKVLTDKQRKGTDPVTLSVDYGSSPNTCQQDWRIVSYVNKYTEAWDIVVMELDGSPMTGTRYVGVNWFDCELTWLQQKEGTLSIYGFARDFDGCTPQDYRHHPFSENDLKVQSKLDTARREGIDTRRVLVDLVDQRRRGMSLKGISGAPLFNKHRLPDQTVQVEVVGIVIEFYEDGSLPCFVCVEPARLAEWWPPLKNAVDAYKDGEKYLKEAVEAYRKGEEYPRERWGEAVEKLNKSKSHFEEAKVSVPRALEQMIAIAKAEQLLPERRWRDVKELIRKWRVGT